MNKISEQIEKNYNITVSSLSVLQDGSDNLVLKVDTSSEDCFVLRISKKEKTVDDVLFETSLCEFLSSNDLPVAKIIRTKNNSLNCLVDGKNAVLFSFCSGEKVNISPSEKTSVKLAYNGGKCLAILHKKLMRFYECETNYGSRTQEQELLRVVKNKSQFREKFINADDFIVQVEDILRKVSGYGKDTILHNDFRIQNVLFDQEDVSAILDFDWACPGNKLKDLAHALVEWSFPDGAKSYWPDIFDNFLFGYESVSGKIDRKELKDWILFSCLSDTATYLMDRIESQDERKEIRSYMYKKYLFFMNEYIE